LKSSLIRGPDGKYSDDDLANILQNATENSANSYGGKGTPACLRVVEIMGIQQARQWGVCTMNEFRQFLGLKRMFGPLVRIRFLHLDSSYLSGFKTFEEWNPDPEIAVSSDFFLLKKGPLTIA
jgi:linoleate 10R-lipoxygenase